MADVRHCPEVDERVETGAVQFGEDWPGLFIRGDDCIALLGGLNLLTAEMPSKRASCRISLGTVIRIQRLIQRDVLGGEDADVPPVTPMEFVFDPDEPADGAVTAMRIRWDEQRLQAAIRDLVAPRPDEEIHRVDVDEHGLRIYVLRQDAK